MSDIDLPSLKEKLWHKMRDDLKSMVPWFEDNKLLLCPTCCRPLGCDEFSVEHIIPQQALADDPAAVRAAVPRNERSGITLLCRKRLIYKGRIISENGCNGWKGKHYDGFIRDLLKPNYLKRNFNSRHHIALFSMGYLGLFREYGYQVALLPSGLLMRTQFFNPNSFIKKIPIQCQMILTGPPPTEYKAEDDVFWSRPFHVGIYDDGAYVGIRNFSMQIPLSRNPTVPLARRIKYAPSKYTFRPDLTTVFD